VKKLKFVTPEDVRVKYNDALHKYTIDGKTVPSVTGVCYGNVDDFMFGKRASFGLAASFGTAVHDLCHEINIGLQPDVDAQIAKRRVTEADRDEVIQHLFQYQSILREQRLEVVGSELLLYSLVRKVAGRTDGIVQDAKGKYWVYDIKTGVLDPRAALQMAGYQFMAEELFKIKIAGGMVFQLNGKKSVPIPKRYTAKSDVNVFLCKLVSLQWDVTMMGKALDK
jgi:hypothetical protein